MYKYQEVVSLNVSIMHKKHGERILCIITTALGNVITSEEVTMKKNLALLLVLVLILTMSACTASPEPETTTDTGGTSTTEETKEPDTSQESTGDTTAKETLTVWCWDPAFNIYAMEEAAKVYKETNPNFELEVIETPWDDVQTKLTTAATSGQYDTLPDIILMQDNAFQKNLTNYPEAFTDLTATSIPFDQFASAKVAYSVLDGKNYGVPFDNGTCIMALRTDYLEQAGLTIDDFTDITWSEFIELGKTVKATTGMALLSAQAGSPDLIMEMLQSCGSSLFNEDGSTNMVGNAALLEAIEVYTTMVKEGILVEVNDWDQYIGTLSNGSVVGTMNGCWILASIQSSADQSGLWNMTNCPALDNIPNATNYTNNGGSSWFVTSNCQDLDLAVDFFNHTFAGSVPFYEMILPSSGALATYLPAGDSEVYSQPSDFFGGQTIFAMITEYAGYVPSNITGPYYYEARDAVGVAMTNAVSGADLESEIQAAEDTVKFQMGE